MVMIANMTSIQNALQDAIDFFGTQAELAANLKRLARKKCTQQMVSNWMVKNSVPPKWALLIEQLTHVSRFRLNPEIYPRDKAA